MTSDCPSAILVGGDSMTVEWMKYFPRSQNLQQPCLGVSFFLRRSLGDDDHWAMTSEWPEGVLPLKMIQG